MEKSSESSLVKALNEFSRSMGTATGVSVDHATDAMRYMAEVMGSFSMKLPDLKDAMNNFVYKKPIPKAWFNNAKE